MEEPEVYLPGEASVWLPGLLIDDWMRILREDINPQKFALSFGVFGEPFLDYNPVDAKKITIELPKGAASAKKLWVMFPLQLVGVVGLPMTFRNQFGRSAYPTSFLTGRPPEEESAQAQILKFEFMATNQLNLMQM